MNLYGVVVRVLGYEWKDLGSNPYSAMTTPGWLWYNHNLKMNGQIPTVQNLAISRTSYRPQCFPFKVIQCT